MRAMRRMNTEEIKEVSVIIPTHNQKKILAKTLDYLMVQDYPKDQYEIIVVDDGSTDGTQEMVKSKVGSKIGFRYLYQEQRGPHFARNLGIEKARGEIIIFVDSDIFTPPNFISEHVRFHQRFGDVVVSGPTVRTDRLDNIFAGIGRKKAEKLLFDFSGPSFITSNLSVKRKFLIRVGGFDEEFTGFGWHDWELGLRLKKLGLKAKRNINAMVYHYKKKINLSDLPSLCKKKRQQGENAALYYKKHPHFTVKFGIRPQSLIFDKLIGWIDKEFGESLILLGTKEGSWWLNLLVKWKLLHAYAEGLRDGLRKYKVRLF
ncbi:MAG: glycosyltransferase [bacterium]